MRLVTTCGEWATPPHDCVRFAASPLTHERHRMNRTLEEIFLRGKLLRLAAVCESLATYLGETPLSDMMRDDVARARAMCDEVFQQVQQEIPR